MAKKTTRPAATDRQAKIQAAAKSSGGGANKIVIAAIVLVVAIVAVVGAVVLQQQSAKNEITAGGKAVPAGTSMGAGFRAFADVTAKPNAPRVDLYLDFQCPACQMFEAAFGPTLKGLAESGQVQLYYHVKNFLDDNLRNDSSTRSAVGAFCAADAGKFQQYFDIVFANHPANEGDGWTNAQLTGFATQAGLSGEALATWQKCFDAQKYRAYVDSVEKQSFEDGVRSTPTMKLNGKVVDLKQLANDEGTAYDPAKLTALIEAAAK